MPLERAALERLLRQLGFESREGHHRVYVLRWQGRTLAQASISRGTGWRTLADNMVADIARDIHIDRQFLMDLVSGKRSREDYLARLREQGIL